ncbi:aminopeptidase N [Nocardioides glacieisoli]|uniref:Aminopeptidase N n=1 Tax=Nocardioides glacieisoli TaxID=1168730 RepID=A0A4Q2S847_9ACTN|nr:aminopeptidase N [Nocardioides glacieisoli]RYB96563.1 aminopeptidase N [Nocardioides glacieisoli]
MPVKSLRQEEAVERAALLSVTSYDIAIDLTDLVDGPAFRAVSTIRFTATPGASTFVDCCAGVESATLNGEPLPAAEEGRIALTGLEQDNELVVASVQADTVHGRGVHRAVDPADKNVYLWTTFEPDEARYAWACFDQPDLKAPHAFTVTAPEAWTVVSNSGDPVVEKTEQGRRWTFEPTPPLSTYNPVVVAGPFFEIRKEAGGYDLGLYARQTLASALERDSEQLFTITAQGLEFFGDRFGMPFPQRKYDQVFLPEFGGAMENYGCVTWADAVIRRHEPTTAEWQLFTNVTLHEMAHMWFGNIVTMRWWDDLWLNEAFAEFACMWAAENATAYGDTAANNLVGDKLAAYLADQGPSSHPIRQPVPSVADAESIFDSITYPKGAAVLKQLMHFVGEQTFCVGMSAYFAEHAWTNTTLDDLVGSLEKASGRDLQPWRTAWLETAGVDRLGIEATDDGLVLTAAGAHGAPHPQVVGVGAYRRSGDALEEIGSVRVEVDGERTAVEGLPEADLYLVNHDDTTFATTRPDAAGREVLIKHPSGLPTTLTRAVAMATVWDMLSSSEATATEAVGALTDALTTESVETVAEPFLQLALTAAQLWAPESARPGLESQVADAARRMVDAGVSRHSAMRVLARTATGEDDLARLGEEAGDDVDLQWYVLQRRAELGDVDAGDVQALEDRDPDPDAWIRALTVRASSPSAEAKEEVWTALVQRTVPVQSARVVGPAFWRPGQDEVLAPYAERFIEALPTLHEGGMIPGLALTASLFPVFAIDEDWITRAREVAAAESAPVVISALTECSEEVLRMVRTRSL